RRDGGEVVVVAATGAESTRPLGARPSRPPHIHLLVPELCLGTPVAKLRFAGKGHKAELCGGRSQAELGSEKSLAAGVPEPCLGTRRVCRRVRLCRRRGPFLCRFAPPRPTPPYVGRVRGETMLIDGPSPEAVVCRIPPPAGGWTPSPSPCSPPGRSWRRASPPTARSPASPTRSAPPATTSPGGWPTRSASG